MNLSRLLRPLAVLVLVAAGCGGSSSNAPRARSSSHSSSTSWVSTGTDSTMNDATNAQQVNASVRGGAPTIVGVMTRAQIVEVVAARDNQVRACWRPLARQLRHSRNVGVLGLTEHVVISWSIQPGGTVSGVQRKSGTVDDVNFFSCVTDALSSMRFPNATGGVVRVDYPYDLIAD